MKRAILLSGDLAVQAHVAGAAARQGVALDVASTADSACEQTALGAALVIVDLQSRGVSPGELVPRLRSASAGTCRIVAFGPHVHENLLAGALEAGCDEILSRGKFHSTIDRILAET